MDFKFNKILIISLFVTLINLFALGCFFAGQNLEKHHIDNGKTMECCGAGEYTITDHAGYNLQYSLNTINYAPLNLLILFVLGAVLFLQERYIFNYYLIKDRYGGFKLFYKFILLFKKGIIHPKIY